MISRQNIVKQINEDWSTKPQSKICIAILNYLIACINKKIPLSHITYGSLRQLISGNYDNSDVLVAIQYLCGDKTHLLEAKFELIEDDDTFDISNFELTEAHKTGELLHPETGELISDFEEKVFMYFQPSSLVKSLQQ